MLSDGQSKSVTLSPTVVKRTWKQGTQTDKTWEWRSLHCQHLCGFASPKIEAIIYIETLRSYCLRKQSVRFAGREWGEGRAAGEMKYWLRLRLHYFQPATRSWPVATLQLLGSWALPHSIKTSLNGPQLLKWKKERKREWEKRRRKTNENTNKKQLRKKSQNCVKHCSAWSLNLIETEFIARSDIRNVVTCNWEVPESVLGTETVQLNGDYSRF